MSSLSQFVGGGGIRPRGLINGVSLVTPVVAGTGLSSASIQGVNITTSGAQTANTLTTVLSLSGQGAIEFLCCASNDATSRTHRMVVTIDGSVIYDGTTAAIATAINWLTPIGYLFNVSASVVAVPEPLVFNTSLLVQYASSLSETSKTNFAYRYIAR